MTLLFINLPQTLKCHIKVNHSSLYSHIPLATVLLHSKLPTWAKLLGATFHHISFGHNQMKSGKISWPRSYHNPYKPASSKWGGLAWKELYPQRGTILDTRRASPLTIITRKYDRIKQLLIRTMKLGVNVRHEAGKVMTISGSTQKLQISKSQRERM